MFHVCTFISSLQDEIFIWFKTILCWLYHLALAIQKIKLGDGKFLSLQAMNIWNVFPRNYSEIITK